MDFHQEQLGKHKIFIKIRIEKKMCEIMSLEVCVHMMVLKRLNKMSSFLA